MAEEVENSDLFEDEGSSEDDYFVAADFDENEALTNGVMMGLDWDSVKQMMYNGFGHLLAQGYPSPDAYREHMREKEKQEKLMQKGGSIMPHTHMHQGPTTMNEFSSFPGSTVHFPPLGGGIPLNATISLPFNPMGPIPPIQMPFRGRSSRGRPQPRHMNNRGRDLPTKPIRGKNSFQKQRKRKGSSSKKDSDHMNLANEDCRFYLAGSCSKGIECTYRHCAEARNTSAICESWQAISKCEDPTKCKFLHPTKQPEAKLCHFFLLVEFVRMEVRVNSFILNNL